MQGQSPPPLPSAQGASRAPMLTPPALPDFHVVNWSVGLFKSIERATKLAIGFLIIFFLLEIILPNAQRPTTVAGGALGNLTAADINARVLAETNLKLQLALVDIEQLRLQNLELIQQQEKEQRLQLQMEELQVRRELTQQTLGVQSFAANAFDFGCALGSVMNDFTIAAATCGQSDRYRRNMQRVMDGVSPSGTSPYRQ